MQEREKEQEKEGVSDRWRQECESEPGGLETKQVQQQKADQKQ